jgi:uncharacterized protein YcbK (DUF882 family)
MAGLFLFGAGSPLQTANANGDTRTLSFHHVHTGENLTITFKRNGRYVPAALKKLDWFMRDWRKNKETHMDPQLFDLLWEVYREVGATKPIEIICGYRAPGTNAMLRARSKGVAEHSQHILGKAMDFFIPGVPLDLLRAVGLRLQDGGVGFYPTSGSPFVHMDVASIRHWPSISRVALQRIFPQGRTVHIPADGKPLRNYAEALADVENRGKVPNGRSLAAARAAGAIGDAQVQEAALVAKHGKRPRTVLAALFGPPSQPYEPTPTPKQTRAPLKLASARVKPVVTTAVVPIPAARPKSMAVAKAGPAKAAGPLVTASLSAKPRAANKRIAAAAPPRGAARHNIWGDPVRNIWGDPVAARPAPATQSPFKLASAEEPATTGSQALSYAPERTPEAATVRARPMGKAIPKLAREATVLPTAGNASVAVKPPAMTTGGQRTDSPWLRAAMLTPSVSAYMTTARLERVNPKWLTPLFKKPARSVLMTFSADPHLGMTADHFTGHAVKFLATATFTTQTTASLR